MPTCARFQRRRVIDAIARHGDRFRRLQAPDLGLAPGRTSARTSSIRRRRATASAVARLSPVSMITRMPSRRNAALDGYEYGPEYWCLTSRNRNRGQGTNLGSGRGVVTQSALEKTEIFAADETGGSIEIIPWLRVAAIAALPAAVA